SSSGTVAIHAMLTSSGGASQPFDAVVPFVLDGTSLTIGEGLLVGNVSGVSLDEVTSVALVGGSLQVAMGGTLGATGATGATGPPITFQGTWSNATTYAVGDAVFFGGSSYVSLTGGNLNSTPSSGAPWALLAQQGDTGPAGPAGADGFGYSISAEQNGPSLDDGCASSIASRRTSSGPCASS
ncbi:MAG: hypothetical protein ACT4QD_21195, partial [Acidobacteriota bacterium]